MILDPKAVKPVDSSKRLGAYLDCSGEKKWLAAFCKPFTGAMVRSFDHEKIDEARTWVKGA
jgi:hypothetical protein